jgi:hypothetical protein
MAYNMKKFRTSLVLLLLMAGCHSARQKSTIVSFGTFVQSLPLEKYSLVQRNIDLWFEKAVIYVEKIKSSIERLEEKLVKAGIDVHFHCTYVGDGKFKLAATSVKTPEKMGVMFLTEIELARFAKNLGNESQIKVGQLKVTCDRAYSARIREYLELVISSYQNALDKGTDMDAELEQLRSDPVSGSGPRL